MTPEVGGGVAEKRGRFRAQGHGIGLCDVDCALRGELGYPEQSGLADVGPRSAGLKRPGSRSLARQ